MRKIYLLLTLLLLFPSCKKQIKIASPLQYPNTLNYKSIPASPKDLSKNAFMDQGSWFGVSFYPGNEIGIAGLFATQIGQWISPQLCQVSIPGYNLRPVEARFFPGFYVLKLLNDSLLVSSKAFFYSSSTVVVEMNIFNQLSENQSINLYISGQLFPGFKWQQRQGVVFTRFDRLGHTFRVAIATGSPIETIKTNQASYWLRTGNIDLQPHKNTTVRVIIYVGDKHINTQKLLQFARSGQKLFPTAYSRWNHYLRSSAMNVPPEFKSLAVKSILTLVNNWKRAYGPFANDVIIPSYSAGYFTGIWAWDTWKQAAATALFNPQLAGSQVREMLRFSDSTGMIYDCVCLDETHAYDTIAINTKNTKPPLAAWAVWNIFIRSKDTMFLQSVYPALRRYHYWWFRYRDYNHNGLCEYGATVNKVYAARWESGMDDAVRFDSARLVKNRYGQYSLMQESPDLNAFLYADKVYLARIATALGHTTEAQRYVQEARVLRQKINKRLWDRHDKWYYDRSIINGRFIRVRGSEGWVPLWAGVPDQGQAAAIAKRMADRGEFNTPLPLPTVSAADPHFMTGYWRGPVWLDQVYFGIAGLRRYGYDSLANALLSKIVHNAQGLQGKDVIYENYSPLDGAPLNARNFSWSAASLLLMIHQDDK